MPTPTRPRAGSSKIPVSSFLLLAFALWPQLVTATTVIRLDLPELVRQADVIVEGQATETRTLWLEGELYTLVTLEVEWALKGSLQAPTQVLLPGGVDLDRDVPVASVWPGGPRIRPGEEVLLFLRHPAPDRSFHTLVGFSQGKVTIRRDASGIGSATMDNRGLERLGPEGRRVPGGVRHRPLAELEGEILELLGTATAEAGR